MDRSISSNTMPAQGTTKRMSRRNLDGGRLTPPSTRPTPSPSPSPSQPQRQHLEQRTRSLTHRPRSPRTSQSYLHHTATPRPSSRSSVQRLQNTAQGDKTLDQPRRRDSNDGIETPRQMRQGEAQMSISPSPPSLTTSHSNSVSPPVRTPPGSGYGPGPGHRSAFGVQRRSQNQPQKLPSINTGQRGRTRRDTESDAGAESDEDGSKTITGVIMTPRPILGQQQWARKRPEYPMLGVSPPHSNSGLNSPPNAAVYSRTPNLPGGEARIPLHRRGTSRTYERMEDLLREAGYKEVRVFTPEGVRASTGSNEDWDDETKPSEKQTTGGALGVVVGLLKGLVGRSRLAAPSSSHTKTDGTSMAQSAEDNMEYEPPASPLAGRTRGHQQSVHDHKPETMPPPALPSPDPSVPKFTGEANDSSYTPSSSKGTVYEDQDATVRASRAGAYLRHVTSAPHMRGATTAGGSRGMKDRNAGRGLFVLNDGSEEEDEFDRIGNGKRRVRGSGEGEDELRIVRREKIGWLGFVTRTVGGVGATSGNMHPQFHLPSHRGVYGVPDKRVGVTYARPGLRQTRSSLSQVSLVSRRSVGKYLAPPNLMTRAGASVGPEVTRARVVCRSAPGSREASPERRVRTGSRAGRGKGRVPSLARTSTSVDGEDQLMWEQVSDLGKPAAEEDVDIASEEDGEVDLAKILVPPKRQNSIRSLRKHLPPALGTAYLPQGEMVARRRSNKGSDEEEWTQWG